MARTKRKNARTRSSAEKSHSPLSRKISILNVNASSPHLERMPLEVAFEIFCYLYPLDLLRLARTGKKLRNFLMSRSLSERIWRTARSTGRFFPELPPIPSNFSEPQFTAFLFDSTFCHVCGEHSKDVVVNWDCKISCHRNCVNKVFLPLNVILENHSELDLETITAIGFFTPSRVHSGSRVYIPSMVEKTLREYMEVKDDPEKLAQWRAKQGQKYLELSKCYDWQGGLIESRRQHIGDRLELLEWGYLGIYNYELREKTKFLYEQAKPFTEEEWNEMEPVFIRFWKDIKDKPFKKERERTFLERNLDICEEYTEFLDARYQQGRAFIPLGDLLLSPDYHPMNEEIYNVPINRVLRIEFTDERQVQLCLEDVTQKWITRKGDQLKAYLNWYNAEYGTTYSDFKTVIFRCKECNAAVWGTRLYVHRCTTHTYLEDQRPPIHWKFSKLYNPFVEKPKSPRWNQKWIEGGGCGVWSLECLDLHPLATEYTKQIMDLCGAKDLETLEEMHPLLECKTCRPPTKVFFRWTDALTHSEEGADMHELGIADVDNETRRLLEHDEVETAIQKLMRSYRPHNHVVICKLCRINHKKKTTSSCAWKKSFPRHSFLHHMEKAHQVPRADMRYGVHFSWTITEDFVYFESQCSIGQSGQLSPIPSVEEPSLYSEVRGRKKDLSV
ncbi:hypothetical protein E1B28_002917 [Marasmius oreades]|uniref:F-box domain-containing protein n=1 Tax=Marasmius oreades TaxID=181124 RepID=A0A9P7ULM5_9AGAR|nr:uncharacterized protein E1B28_002917 [Marasmius oreades]KAG7085351.1 hypothetical protein E1B28_002917 [Marasmius oreades]